MAILQPAEVRTLIPSLGSGEEERLTALIARADAVCARWCGLGGGFGVAAPSFQSTTYTDYLPGPGGAELQLPRYPLVSVTSIEDDPTEGFDGTSYLVSSSDYRVHKDEGIVRLDQDASIGSWSKAPARVIKAVYVAGYAANGLPEDIKMALALQVVAWMNGAQAFGLASAGTSAASHSPREVTNAALHPEVRAMLAQHRCISVLL